MAPTLGYWDIRGLGAPIRHLLAYAGVEYEDKRYADPDAWFQKDKFALGLDFPNLPYYIDGDVKLSQTQAILRYIARKNNLDGSNEQEKIAISLVEQQIADLNQAIVKICYDPNCEKLKEEYLKNLPTALKSLSTYLGDRPFFAGSNISYVDFWAYEYLKKISILVPGGLDEFANLTKFLGRIESLPQMSAYFKNAKPGLFNGPMAKWNATL